MKESKDMNGISDLVQTMVQECYRRDDVNCATAMLRILGRSTSLVIHPQVLAAATGMHGAGRYGAQCGLVEGGLMFLGIWGRERGLPEESITDWCSQFAQGFEIRFGSLSCRVLRPQGFAPGQPPHMCEGLTLQAAQWAVDYCHGL